MFSGDIPDKRLRHGILLYIPECDPDLSLIDESFPRHEEQMKIAQGAVGRVFVLRLEDGDRIPDTIEAFAAEQSIEAALCSLLGGIGSGRVVVGPENPDASPIVPLVEAITGVREAAAVGTIFPNEEGKPRLHLHAALGRGDETVTGCARQGLDVWKVCEVVLIEITGANLVRATDPVAGFEVLTQK